MHGGKTVLRISLVVAALAACGDEPDIKSFDQIDAAAWEAELRSAIGPGAAPNINMRTFYDLTVKDCDATVDQLALKFTLTGAHPDWTRINMSYVCPSRAHKVGEALAENRETEEEFNRICNTPRELRTPDEEQLVEAAGTCQ